ncbi:NHL repeat-containing protein [Geotalea toluenoxydans]
MQIHSSTNSTLRYRHILFFLCLLIYLPGCFAPKQVKAPVFFPPAPDAPHVQYLTSISSINDIKSSIFADTPGVNEVIAKPYGIAVRGSKIFITDVPLGRITTIDLNEKTFHQLDTEILKSPINISFDDEGNAFVADTGSKKVIRFNGDNPTGTFSIGDMKPTDAAIRGKELYVVDYSSSEIKIFDLQTGEQTRAVGRDSKEGETLSLPTNMALDKDGNIYVTNLGTCRIIKMDPNGKVLKAFGALGDRPGQFTRPKGIAVDDAGLIYVVDAGNQVVQIFDPDGQLLMFFGERGSKEGTLSIPADIAITRENLEYFRTFADPSFEAEQLILVTNQSGPRKISIYGFGHRKEIAGT